MFKTKYLKQDLRKRLEIASGGDDLRGEHFRHFERFSQNSR